MADPGTLKRFPDAVAAAATAFAGEGVAAGGQREREPASQNQNCRFPVNHGELLLGGAGGFALRVRG